MKLGSNPELEKDVLPQLRNYMKAMDGDLSSFAVCYERTYRQMKLMGLLDEKMPDGINIIGPVEGMIVVGGYTGIASQAIEKLRAFAKASREKPDSRIQIWQPKNRLTNGASPLSS